MSQFGRSRAARALAGVASAALVASCMVIFAEAAAAAPTAPDGIWYTKGDESIIKVTPCPDAAETFCGFLIWLKEPNESDGTPKKDTNNKDPAKKDRPIVGLKILIDMKADDDHWAGKAYNPEDGKKYSITFKVKEETDKADLRGCILGFLCQTETFTRAKEVPGGEPDLAQIVQQHKKHRKKNAETQ